MANVQCNASICFLKETPFSWRTNDDKLTTNQLGPPRPNVSIQQVSTRGGNPTSKNWYERKSWLAGCEVANTSVFLYTTVTFHRFHSVFHNSLLALTLNHFLCDDLFCFCKPILSRSVNKYCWFDLYVTPSLCCYWTYHVSC